MATYQILEDIHYYLKDTTTGYAGWGTFKNGSTATGGPIAGSSNSTWRTVMGITITPATGEKVTSFTLNIGLINQDSKDVKLGGYLYTDFNTAKVASNPPIDDAIAHFEESTEIDTPYSGRIVNMTWSGLNITSPTTVYVWFYVSPSYYCQIWTGKTGNFKNETNFPSVTFNSIEPISYTATFNANGGTTPSPQTITKGYGTALGTLPTTSRVGYTFKGWYTAASGGTKISTTTTMPANNVTYYAQWNIIQYIISYDANGGTGAPAAQTKDYGKTLTLSLTKPAKSGTSTTGYTVTFDANGGSCSTTSLTSTKTISYPFSKWTTGSTGTGDSYNAGASYTENASATLYAQYTTTTTNNAITLPTPTRNGYIFKGWATSSTATSGSFGSYVPSAVTTLYAVWGVDTSAGLVYIDNGQGWEAYEVYIDNGTTWEKYIPYIDNGTTWELYS